jgi:hypothetical protein
VIGTHDRRLVGVFFQSSGELIRVEERAQPVEELSRLSVLDAELALWPHLEMWKAEIGFTPCAIRVKAFFLPELDIGIDTFPESEQAAIDAERPLVDPATGEPLHLDFSPHDNRHCFLFWWRKDYWMNAMGEVTDS